jgi:hypothetical protein
VNLSSYLVIATDLLAAKDKEKILAEVVNIKTPKPPFPDNFTVKWLDHFGRVAVITYRGAEVLLLFKKMTSQLSTLSLEVAPRAYLKNDDDAWEAIKLVDIYTGVSIGERVKELEKAIKQKDQMIEMLQLQLDASDEELALALNKNRKKAAKTTPKVIPTLLSSVDINKYLLKIKPIKLQDIIRAHFLWAQGFGIDLIHGSTQAPDTPKNYKKKVFRHGTKLSKMLKQARLDKQIAPYEVRPPKVKVSKNKVVKKKKSKKP